MIKLGVALYYLQGVQYGLGDKKILNEVSFLVFMIWLFSQISQNIYKLRQIIEVFLQHKNNVQKFIDT